MTRQRKPGLRQRLKGLMQKRMHGMLTCREFEDFVLGYLDGDLTGRQRSMFEWHLRLCRECREYLAAYKRTMELGPAVQSAADGPVPDDVPRELIEAILASREH